MSNTFDVFELTNGIKTAEAKAQSKHHSRPSDWLPHCEVKGCIMAPSVNFAGHQLCAYHHGEDPKFYAAITQAITSMRGILSRYVEMTQWSSTQWNIVRESETGQPLRIGKAKHLIHWSFCPYKGESPSHYLHHLSDAIHTEIKRRASEIYQQNGDAA